jgi:hypothetical protein
LGGEFMNKLILIVLLTLIGFIISTPPNVEALSCAPPQPVQQEMEQSSIVFKGRAIDIKNGGLTVFRVEEAWKGIEDSVVEIYDNGWDPYIKDTDYLVFGSLRNGELRSNLCGRTGPWDIARKEAMKETNIQPTVFNIEVPLVVTERSEQSRPQLGTNVLVALLLVLILISLIIVWKRKKRRS